MNLLYLSQIELSLTVHMPPAFFPTMPTCVWVALNGKTCDLHWSQGGVASFPAEKYVVN